MKNTPEKSCLLLGAAASLLLLAGCSGGGAAGDPTPDTETPETGAASPVVATSAVSGRVADGYIQGATICVDINENGACDDDEPSTVSGNGGAYTLDIPEDATDKPILSMVPPSAIDEDTGEAIGKELHFSTPGDKPTFLSPITTLVHQELKNNPSLGTADAEAVVLETLGMPGEAEDSLFSDYVANSETGDTEAREKFHYLHQTARVLASMMGDIQEEVLEAAEENGIDVAGDPETKAAILQLVREEVRELLPEISAAVAEEIHARQEAADSENDGGEPSHDVDPNDIAEELIRDDVSDDLVTQIDDVKAENPVERAAMQTLLSNGFYLLDVDCHHGDDDDREDAFDQDLKDDGTVILNDDGSPGRVDLPAYCMAHYTHVTLDSDTQAIQSADFFYDMGAQQWVPDTWEADDERPDLLVLENGQWLAMLDDGPRGKVEFTSDGAAVLAVAGGKMVVNATQKALDNTSVLHHLTWRGADDDVAEVVDPDSVFTAGAEAYRLNIKRDTRLTVLFNWYAHDDTGFDPCAQFGGNCNVVGLQEDRLFKPVQSLSTLQEGSINGIVIDELMYADEWHFPIAVSLHADQTTDNTIPTSGTVKWIKSVGVEHYPEPPVAPCPAHDVPEDAEPAQKVDGNEDPVYLYECSDPNDASKVLVQQRDDHNLSNDNAEPHEEVIAKSHWKQTVEDGVTMIDIEIPMAMRHHMTERDIVTLLLLEQGGFVRRGARFSAGAVDDEVAYNAVAFETLQPIIEDYVTEDVD